MTVVHDVTYSNAMMTSNGDDCVHHFNVKQELLSIESIQSCRLIHIDNSNDESYVNNDVVMTVDTSKEDAHTQLSKQQLILHEEDTIILKKFCAKILSTFGTSSSDMRPKYWRVSASAIVYFQRFYMHNSLCDHDPNIVMMACVYLSGKIEDHFVKAEELLELLPSHCSKETLLSYEMILLQSLNFDLRVYHPKNLVPTLIADLRLSMAEGMSSGVNSTRWIYDSDKTIRSLQQTYASLCYNPFVIAIFALIKTSGPACDKEIIGNYISNRFGDSQCSIVMNQMDSLLVLYNQVIETLDEDRVSACYRRLEQRANNWIKKIDDDSIDVNTTTEM